MEFAIALEHLIDRPHLGSSCRRGMVSRRDAHVQRLDLRCDGTL
jgi:hypothetical protein